MQATYKKTEGIYEIITADGPLPLMHYESSRLTAAGYDPGTQCFYIAFPTGSVYEYQGVDALVAEEFEEAESKGSFANKNIIGPPRKPIYQYRKLDEKGPYDGETESMARAVSRTITGGGDHPSHAVHANVAASPAVVNSSDRPTQSAVAGIAVPRTVASATNTGGPSTGSVDTIPELPTKDEELPTYALTVQNQARGLTITNPPQYTQGANFLKRIKEERRLMAERAARFYDPAFEAYKAARDLRDEALKPYDEAEKIVKAYMLDYDREEQRQRREAETAERRRLEEKAREEARIQSEEQAKRDAEYLRAQGEHKQADIVAANPLPVAPKPVAPVVLERQVPTTQGVSRRENWTYRVTDASQIPLTHEFYTLDPKKLAAKAKLLKSHAEIPGVEVFDEGTIAVR